MLKKQIIGESNCVEERKNIKYGVIISYVSLAVSIILHIFFTPFLLDRVGQIQYGLLAFVTSITSWFTIGAYALNDSFIKFSTVEFSKRGDNKRSNAIYIKLLIILGLGISLIGAILYILLKANIIPLNNYSENEKNEILLLYCISLMQVIFTTVFAFFRLFNEYKSNFIFIKTVALASTFTTTFVNIVYLQRHSSVVFIAIVGAIAAVVTLLLYYAAAKIKYNIVFGNDTLKDNVSYVKEIITYSSYLLLSVIVTEINTSVDKTILGFFSGASYVTVYQLGLAFDTYYSEFVISVNSVFIPRINMLVVENKHESVKDFFLDLSGIQSIIVFLIIGGFYISGKEFIAAWLGENQPTVYVISLVLMILHSVHYCSYSSQIVQRAYSKHKIPACINLAVALINVIVSVILVSAFPIEYSVWMCLIGTVFAEVLGRWIIIPIYNYKALGLPMVRFYFQMLRIAIICVISCLTANYCFHFIFRNIGMAVWKVFFFKSFTFLIIYLLLVIPSNFYLIKKIYDIWRKK